MFNSLLTLIISHNISLTSEQRKKLASGDSVATVGVSVPVWHAKSKTSEPAKEVFVNYIIHNHPEAGTLVHFKADGYEFNIPQLPNNFEMPPEMDDNEWRNLEPEEREAIAEERYVPLNGKNLLDPKEGGSGKLIFTRTARAKMRDIPTTVHHIIKIADISELKESLT
jgi:hypothetical protein